MFFYPIFLCFSSNLLVVCAVWVENFKSEILSFGEYTVHLVKMRENFWYKIKRKSVTTDSLTKTVVTTDFLFGKESLL